MENVKLTLQWLGLMIVAILGFILLAPILFVVQIIYRLFSKEYNLWYYFKAIAVGIDALGGSIIYGSRLHTISGMTGYFSCITNYKSWLFRCIAIWHRNVQAPFIDYFFGKRHSYKEALDEDLIKGCK